MSCRCTIAQAPMCMVLLLRAVQFLDWKKCAATEQTRMVALLLVSYTEWVSKWVVHWVQAGSFTILSFKTLSWALPNRHSFCLSPWWQGSFASRCCIGCCCQTNAPFCLSPWWWGRLPCVSVLGATKKQSPLCLFTVYFLYTLLVVSIPIVIWG